MQKGQIKRRGNAWLVRYWVNVKGTDGKETRKRVAKRLAAVGGEYRTAASVQHLADELLAPINAGAPAESTLTLKAYVEQHFLPSAVARLKPSTGQTYKTIWKLVEPKVNGIELREYRTSHIDAILTAVGARGLSHNTNKKTKAFLSGVFREARRADLITGDPVSDARLPKGKAYRVTEAYQLDEVVSMLKVLGEPSRTGVLVAALTGLRVSEIKGLRWSDYNGEVLNITRSVWQGKVSDTKTLTSAAPVPVVGPVRDALQAQRKRVPSNVPWIFPGAKLGRPLRLENETRRVIVPTLKKAKIEWRGWHAFRRGVGSILNALGVDAKTIQTILRHARVETTQAFYVKPVDAAAKKAMGKLAAAFKKKMR
jgi:integrase